MNGSNGSGHAPILVAEAAAGYGKTTVLLDLARRTALPVAWLTLDATDRNPRVLLADLTASLVTAFPDLRRSLRRGRFPAGGEWSAEVLADSIERHGEWPFLLCVDDVHWVDAGEAAGQLLARFLDQLPGSVRLAIAGRAEAGPLLGRRAIGSRRVELSEAELRFTAEETRALLEASHLPSASDPEALAAESEGWISAILLSASGRLAGGNHRSARDGRRHLDGYFAREVWNPLPEHLQAFVVESAVLPEMDAEALDAVLGRSDSAALLREAEARHLFVTCEGDDCETYRFHHLFRKFLLGRLRARWPGRLEELRRRAGLHLEEGGEWERAVRYHLAGGSPARAASIVEARAPGLYAAGRGEVLGDWSRRWSTAMEEVPVLHMNLSRLFADRGRLGEADRALAVAASGFATANDRRGQIRVEVQRSDLALRGSRARQALALAENAVRLAGPEGDAALLGLANRQIGACHLALGEFTSAEEVLRQAASDLEGAGEEFERASALHDLARVLRIKGRAAEASRLQREALAAWRELGNPGRLAAALLEIGRDEHLLGHGEEAGATLARALGHARHAQAICEEILILAAQADLASEKGDPESAARLLRSAFERTNTSEERSFIPDLYLCRARIERRSGNVTAALESLRRAEVERGDPADPTRESEIQVLRGLALLDLGDSATARDWLARARARAEELGISVPLARASFGLARAEFARGCMSAAEDALRQALSVVERTGYLQPLRTEAEPAGDLLLWARTLPGLGARLSAAFGQGMRAAVEPTPQDGTASEVVGEAETLVVQALGETCNWRGGVEMKRQGWVSKLTRELLLFLVDRGPTPKAAVLRAFWPHLPERRAGLNFYQTVYRLRGVLGHEAVILEDGILRLNEGLVSGYDVARFERAAHEAKGTCPGRVGALAEAVALYGGDYLVDLTAEWASARRKGLREVFADLLCAYADELMALTLFAEARAALMRGLEAEPLRDDLHARMLRCLAGLGRRHEVAGHYQRYRSLLRQELGLEPPAETRAMVSRLIDSYELLDTMSSFPTEPSTNVEWRMDSQVAG